MYEVTGVDLFSMKAIPRNIEFIETTRAEVVDCRLCPCELFGPLRVCYEPGLYPERGGEGDGFQEIIAEQGSLTTGEDQDLWEAEFAGLLDRTLNLFKC